MTEEFKIGVTAGNICFSKEVDSWDIRNNEIPLPGGNNSSDGYSRVLFVGTTGAGKTTIVRQLLGTDPDTERFPSISAAFPLPARGLSRLADLI